MASERVNIASDKQALKAVDGALIRAAGGVEAAAAVCRVGKSTLSEYGRPDNECFMPSDVRADLEAVTHGTLDHPISTRYAARRLGYALVRLPAGDTPRGHDLAAALRECIRESGEAHTAIVEMIGEGHIGLGAARRARREAMEAVEAKMRLIGLLDQVIDGGGEV